MNGRGEHLSINETNRPRGGRRTPRESEPGEKPANGPPDRAAGSSSPSLLVPAAARPPACGRGAPWARETKKEVYICEDADGNHCITQRIS